MGCKVTDRSRVARLKPSILSDAMEQDRHLDRRLRHNEFVSLILGESGDVSLNIVSVAKVIRLGFGLGSFYVIHGFLLPRTPISSGSRVSCCK